MQEQNVLEVVTPALSVAATTDPNIQSFQVEDRYLHTSPEFPMKRLLAACKCDIYQIATVFRNGEAGRFHNAEFSMLEWYRVGMNHHQLIDDVLMLLQGIAKQFKHEWKSTLTIRYTDAVAGLCNKPFPQVGIDDIKHVFKQRHRSYPEAIGNDIDAALDLLMDEFVIAQFAPDQLSVIVDYPASQASLARVHLNDDQLRVASRFEIYWGSLELANGFHELSDAGEQRSRFESDLRVRAERDQASVPIDEHLLQALESGLPNCAGVAMGLERLLMVLSGQKHIDDVLAFSVERA